MRTEMKMLSSNSKHIRRMGWMIGLFILVASLILMGSNQIVGAAGTDLLKSDIVASKSQVSGSEKVTLTANLRNDGSSAETVQLAIWVMDELEIVSGSATGGGSESDEGVEWEDIVVPAGGTRSFSVDAVPSGSVTSGTKTTTAWAGIIAGDLHFLRFTEIKVGPGGGEPEPTTEPEPTSEPEPTVTPEPTIVPEPTSEPEPTVEPEPTTEPEPPTNGKPNLLGSFKYASKLVFGPNDSLTYTIHLYNSGTADAVATVEDELPEDVEFVSGSVSDNGEYDESADIVTWEEVEVPMGEVVKLTFEVTGRDVFFPTPVVNEVDISYGDKSISRSTLTMLVPEIPVDDLIPPTVEKVTINGGDIHTDREVTVSIEASDNEKVTEMYVREWQLNTNSLARWEVVESSGWVPYESEFEWTLGDESGVHFIGVWVRDENKNSSWLNNKGMDFANLIVAGEEIDENRVISYLVDYDAGENVSITLETMSGDADLYVWYPGNFGKPNQQSIAGGTNVDSISFETAKSGKYLISVYGYEASTYDIEITPAGGESTSSRSATVSRFETTAQNQNKTALTTETVLTNSGVDPLSEPEVAPAQSPLSSDFNLYLPMFSNN